MQLNKLSDTPVSAHLSEDGPGNFFLGVHNKLYLFAAVLKFKVIQYAMVRVQYLGRKDTVIFQRSSVFLLEGGFSDRTLYVQ